MWEAILAQEMDNYHVGFTMSIGRFGYEFQRLDMSCEGRDTIFSALSYVLELNKRGKEGGHETGSDQAHRVSEHSRNQCPRGFSPLGSIRTRGRVNSRPKYRCFRLNKREEKVAMKQGQIKQIRSKRMVEIDFPGGFSPLGSIRPGERLNSRLK